MKNFISLVILVIALVSCKETKKEETTTVKDYVTFSGKITNQNSDSLIVMNRNFQKVIKVNTDGTFKDTFKVSSNDIMLFDGKEYIGLYLKNNDDVNLTLDAKNIDKTIKFAGLGAVANNYLAQTSARQKEIYNDKTIFAFDKPEFDANVEAFTAELINLIDKTEGLDSSFVALQKQSINGFKSFYLKAYPEKHYIAKNLAKGTPSPKFKSYENYNGGTTSLDDLKGKYVYIDMWATWCGPCKAEIPSLKDIEKQYHGKNIEFVSISIDKQNAYQTWKNMVKEKELSGVQLYAKQDEKFTEAYRVSGIPRFILIDPQGNIVEADAPRPSDPRLKKLFKELKI